MNARTCFLPLSATAAALVLAACTSTPTPTQAQQASGVPAPTGAVAAGPSGPTTLTDSSAVLTVQDQTSEGPTVTIKAVALSEPGHVVIVGDGGRNVLGSSLVEPGSTPTSIQVSLAEEPTEKITLMARLYADTDGDGFYSAGDQPVTNGKAGDDTPAAFAGLQQTFSFTGAKVVNN